MDFVGPVSLKKSRNMRFRDIYLACQITEQDKVMAELTSKIRTNLLYYMCTT